MYTLTYVRKAQKQAQEQRVLLRVVFFVLPFISSHLKYIYILYTHAFTYTIIIIKVSSCSTLLHKTLMSNVGCFLERSEENVFPELCNRLLQCCRGVDNFPHFWDGSCQTGLAPEELCCEKNGWHLKQATYPPWCLPSVIPKIQKMDEILNEHSITEDSQRNSTDNVDCLPVKLLYHRAKEHA